MTVHEPHQPGVGGAHDVPDITSLTNPRVKTVVALRRRRSRDQTTVIPVEGFAELSLAVRAGAHFEEVFWCPVLVSPSERSLLTDLAAGGVLTTSVSREVFAKMSYRESPDGWLGLAHSPATTLDKLTLPPNPLVVVCEALEKPGNLGAILRTADAAGVAAVVAADPVTDWQNPNVVRASKGTVFSVPHASATTDQTLAWLEAQHLPIVIASPRARTTYTDANLSSPCALVIGSERDGLTDIWFQRARTDVVIPMRGVVDSLNAATSAALLIYEALRQRAIDFPTL